MTTMRRLSDDDVRAIFESLHGCHPPPDHLKFQIVPVGSEGLKLSPPSFEFEDGLYVLLRPEKKKKHGSAAEALRANAKDRGSKVPDHLKHLVMNKVPSETCPWSLSGPQFPQPTAIQQRYCYPKGNPDYAGRKGGALWTMYGRDGKEDFQFRLLHVYFSAKRAVNKGVTLSEQDKITQRLQNEAASAAATAATSTPARQRKRESRAIPSPWQGQSIHQHYGRNKRFRTSSGKASSPQFDHVTKRSRGIDSPPTPFVGRGPLLPPPSPFQTSKTVLGSRADGSIYVSPNTAASSENSGNGGHPFDHHMFDHPPFHPVPSFDVDENAKSVSEIAKNQFPFRGTNGRRSSLEQFRCDRALIEGSDSFPYNEASVTEISGNAPTLEAWNGSLFAFGSKPSFEQTAAGKKQAASPSLHYNEVAPILSAESLKARLGHVHERIRAGILAHPASEQGVLLSIVSSWAHSVAASPLVPTIQTSQGISGQMTKIKNEPLTPDIESTAV